MVDLSIKDANATATGGCGCGNCGCGEAEAVATEQAVTDCGCGPDCTCGCQEGKPCTCGESAVEQAPDAAGAVATYTVSGMTCGHCVKAITEEVSAIEGVTGVSVDLESGALRVVSESPVDFDRIVEAVAEAGDYTVE